jgi:hypothetical protein
MRILATLALLISLLPVSAQKQLWEFNKLTNNAAVEAKTNYYLILGGSNTAPVNVSMSGMKTWVTDGISTTSLSNSISTTSNALATRIADTSNTLAAADTVLSDRIDNIVLDSVDTNLLATRSYVDSADALKLNKTNGSAHNLSVTGSLSLSGSNVTSWAQVGDISASSSNNLVSAFTTADSSTSNGLTAAFLAADLATSNRFSRSIGMSQFEALRWKLATNGVVKMFVIGDSLAESYRNPMYEFAQRLGTLQGYRGEGLGNYQLFPLWSQSNGATVGYNDSVFLGTYTKVPTNGIVTWTNYYTRSIDEGGLFYHKFPAGSLVVQKSTNGVNWDTATTISSGGVAGELAYATFSLSPAAAYHLRITNAAGTTPITNYWPVARNSSIQGIETYFIAVGGSPISKLESCISTVTNMVATLAPDFVWTCFFEGDSDLVTLSNQMGTTYAQIAKVCSSNLLVQGIWQWLTYPTVTNAYRENSVYAWGAQRYGFSFFDSMRYIPDITAMTNYGWAHSIADSHLSPAGGKYLLNATLAEMGITLTRTNASSSSGSTLPATFSSDGVTNQIGQGAVGASQGLAVGYGASGGTQGTAIGYNALGSSYGVAVGLGSEGRTEGVGVGYLADGDSHGVAVGRGAYGYNYGTAVGEYAYGFDTGLAFGNGAKGTNGGIALGAATHATGDGTAAIGRWARVETNVTSSAVQLGRGTNTTSGSLQFRTWTVVNGSGYIPPQTLASTNGVTQPAYLVLSNNTVYWMTMP